MKTEDFDRLWNGDTGNLENSLLIYDFLRIERDYSPERPLILCKDGGLLAVFRFEGLDPEPLNEDGLSSIAGGMRRAFEVFSQASLEGDWRAGRWEIQNIFARGEGRASLIPAPRRDSAAARMLIDGVNRYWQSRPLFEDDILWAVKYSPRNKDSKSLFRLLNSEVWSLFGRDSDIRLGREELRERARFVRGVLAVFEETLKGIRTRRPNMSIGAKWLTEEEAHRALWQQINLSRDEPPPLQTKAPLLTQVANSYRTETSQCLEIDGRPTRLLTWKVPPELSVAYLFRGLQTELRFPFTVVQNFTSIDYEELASGPFGLRMRERFASATKKNPSNRAFADEANDLADAVQGEKCCVFRWYFAVVVSGRDTYELESRVTKLRTFLKRLRGSDVMEERENRALGALAIMPGNARYGLRHNIVTSRSAAGLAMVFRLSRGDSVPSLIFSDRQGGAYAYAVQSRSEPNNNKAVLGPSGSGKSVLLQSLFLGTTVVPSQGYVMDEGNSFGPLFELLSREKPDEVAVMRYQSDDFQFNPAPMVWALEERERQIARGTYRQKLEDGTQLPCPVADVRTFFEAWLEGGILSQREPLPMAKKNQLDRALKGASGNGGFFREFENHCRRYIEESRRGIKKPPPRPLSALLTHLRSEAPEFVPAVELWTRAPRDRFFDSGMDTVQRAKYVYFELAGLDKDPLLAVPFLMALMGSVWQRVKDPSLLHESKAILIDEAWKRLAHPAFFGVVNESYREARKYKGFVALSTQSTADLLEGNARKLLATMSEFFLYRGFGLPEEVLKQDLELTSAQIGQLRSLQEDDQRREVYYVSRRGMNRVLSVELPPTLYWFVTTDPQDKEWRSIFCKRYGLSGGIEQLVVACGGRTIVNAPLRLDSVEQFARKHGLVSDFVEEDLRCA